MSDVAGMDASSSTTNFEEIHHWHEWKIKKFSTAIKRGELKSSVFTIKACDEYEWYLRLTYNASLETKIPQYSLRLRVNKGQEEFLINLTLGIIDINKSFLHTYEEEGILGKLRGAETFMTLSDFENGKGKYLNGDTLTIGCKIILLKPVSSPSVPDEELFPLPIGQLSHDFLQLFDNAKTSDIIFTVGDQKLYAHRTILMARSSVFDAIFQNQMQESIQKIINIDDLDAEVVGQLLKFIYTDTTNLENKTSQLLYAAEKYNLQRLKTMCEKTLFKNICAETAAETLMVANRYNAHRLETHVCHFIASNMREVLVTKGYEEMERNHPELVAKFLSILRELMIESNRSV